MYYNANEDQNLTKLHNNTKSYLKKKAQNLLAIPIVTHETFYFSNVIF